MKAMLPLFARIAAAAGLIFVTGGVAGANDVPRFAHHAPTPAHALLDSARQHPVYDLGSLPVYFEKDPAGARFQTRTSTSGLLFERGGFWVGFGPSASPIHVTFPGARGAVNPSGQQALPVFSNYFLGNDPSQWSRRQHYEGVRYDALWPGIDLVFYAQRRQLEYDFNVAPHADVGRIRLRVDGADAVTVDARGELWIANQYGKTRQPRPAIYQEIDGRRVAVAGGYRMEGEHQVGFWLGAYDHSRKLVIDPVLEFASYIGGSGFDMATAVTVDSSNNVYVAGYAQFPNFRTAIGAQHPAPNSQTGNVFLMKLDAVSKQIDYIDYYGGNVYDLPLSVKVDNSGYVTIVGSTDSSNLPAVSAAVSSAPYISQTSYGFAVRFQPNGASLAYSTYTAPGAAYGVALNSAGAAWVVGGVDCGYLQLTNGAQQTTCNQNAGEVGYVMQIAASGSLQYSSYYAPAAQNQIQSYLNDAAADSQGNFYVAGTMGGPSTLTRAEQASPGVYQNALSSNYICEVTKFNSNGQPLWIQTIGGSMDQECLRIATDTNYVYLAGYTTSQNFPATSGAFQTAIGKSPLDIADAGDSYAAFGSITSSGVISRPLIAGFVAKYSSSGGNPLYASYLGGNGDDFAWGIAVNGSGNAYVTGYTNSRNFPVTPGAPQTTYGGGQGDAYVTGFSADGTQLTMSTFYGGSAHDEGYYVAADSLGNVWMVGGTESASLPVTSDAFQTTLENADGMVVKFNLQTCNPTVALANPVLSAASGTTTLTLTTAPAGCSWTLAAIQTNGGAVPWIQFSPASGSGNQTVTMTTTANTTAQSRLAVIVANSLRTFVYQSGQTACQYVLLPTEMALTSASERHQIAIQASNQTCSWTASSNQSWLHILSPVSGAGAGALTIGTDPNTSSTARTATLTIGSQTITVGQSAGGCNLVLSAGAPEFSPAGGLGTLNVLTGSSSSQCSWQAQATQSWIELVPITNYGSGTVRFSVPPNTTPQTRTGAITVGSQSAIISQDAAFTPLETATGSNTTASQADVSTAHPAPAIVRGPGRRPARPDVELRPSALGNCGTGPQPSTPIPLDAAGDAFTFTVTRQRSGCGISTFWNNTPTSFNVTQAASGANNVTFTITATANMSSQPLTNSLLVQTGDTSTGIWTLPVTQAGTAVAPLSVPQSLQLPAAAGSTDIPVSSTTGNPCNWTVDPATVPPWLTLVSSSGSCGSQLQFNFMQNGGLSQRTATLGFLTGEHTQLLQQASAPTPCTYSFQQTTPQDIGFNGGQVTLNVQTTSACSWTASTDSPGWITLPAGIMMGSGALAVQAAANNTTSQRVAQISVGFTDPVSGLPAMAAATVTEDPAPSLTTSCSYTLSPTSNAFPNTGGPFTFQVTTTSGCVWQPSQPPSDASYVHLQSTSSVTGSGSVTFTVDANPANAAARSSSITVATGVSFAITEAAGPVVVTTCSYTLTPTSNAFANTGGSFTFQVTTTSGCVWQPSQPAADASYVHLQSTASQTGSGSVIFTVDANPANAAARSSSITVATGVSFAITEAAGPVVVTTCSYTLSPTSNAFGNSGGSFTFQVTTTSGCVWQPSQPAADASYVHLQSTASVTGSGSVMFTVDPNPTGGAARSSSITVATGVSFAITQAAGPVVTGPATSSLTPNFATAGGAAFTLTVNGTGFVSGSTVQWNGTGVSTSFVSSTQLTASITANLIATAGAATVTVVNSGGVTSNAVTFVVNGASVNVQTISHVADGAGWRSTIVLVNTDVVPALYTVSFWSDTGGAGNGAGSVAFSPVLAAGSAATSGTIPVGGSIIIQTADANQNTLTEGWAQVMSSQAIGGTAIFRYDTSGQEAAVPLLTSGGAKLEIPYQIGSGLALGTALANPSATQTANVTEVVRSQTGAQISSRAITVAPLSHYATVPPALGTVTGNGVVEYDSNVNIFGLGIRLDGSAFTSVDAVLPLASSTKTISHIADGAGWRSTIILVNTDTVTASYTVNFWQDTGGAGSGTGSTTLVPVLALGAASGTIPVGGSVTIQTADANPNTLTEGWAQVVSSQSIGGTAIFRYDPSSQEAAVPLLTGGGLSLEIPYQVGNGLALGTALANPSATQTAIVTEVTRDQNGHQLSTRTITILPQSHYATVPPALANVTGSGTIEYISNVSIYALGIRLNGSAFTSVRAVYNGGTVAATPSGTLTATPNPLNVCSAGTSASVILTWSASNVTSVKVTAGSLTGTVVASGGANGAMTTSATSGTTYYLVDTSSGGAPTAANVLSQVTLQQGVCAVALAVTTASLPGGTVGAAYSTSLSASGGAPPYSWSATGLPAGLSVSAAGSITGTPTVSGSFTIGVKVTDTNASTASLNLTLSIAAASTGASPAPTGDLMQSIANWQIQFLDNGASAGGGAANDTSQSDVLDGTSAMYVYSTSANQIVLTTAAPANGWNLSTISTIQMSMQSDVPPGLWVAGTPYFRLISANGSLTLTPVSPSAANASYVEWDTLTAPLAGNSNWTATTSGQFNVQSVTSIQVTFEVVGVQWAVLLNGMFLK